MPIDKNSYWPFDPINMSLLESSKYHGIRLFGKDACDTMLNAMVEIQSYSIYEVKGTSHLSAMIYGLPRQGVRVMFSMFIVEVYDDPTGNGIDLLYSFDELDNALELIRELQGKAAAHYTLPSNSLKS